ncbi:hypothetical protein [Micromonospora sp. NPDC005652]|uniref:hypothetical protein n=1 Tax=Micromonospora sp. NPDC005652 TaxID=3157046 RepID=UPI0033C1578D
MISQGYELWLAEAYPEGGTAPVGRVIAWDVAQTEADPPRDWSAAAPVVAFDAVGTEPATLRPARGQWFLGPTAEVAASHADAFVEQRDAPARQQREQERHLREQKAWVDKVRRATDEGDLRFLHAAVVQDVRRMSNARIAETVEKEVQFDRVGQRSLEAWLPRGTHEDMVPVYDKAIRSACKHLLGDEWTVDVKVKPRKLFG